MGRHESEYFVRRDTEKQIQELKERPPDPDKPVLAVDRDWETNSICIFLAPTIT